MNLKKIEYSGLNSRQKEIYNFQKVAALLADYGFNCLKLSDDWQGADFLAYHKDGKDTLRVQLKSRLYVGKKYVGKNLHVCFPLKNRWYLVPHDDLVEAVGTTTNYLASRSWLEAGGYSTDGPNQELMKWLEQYIL